MSKNKKEIINIDTDSDIEMYDEKKQPNAISKSNYKRTDLTYTDKLSKSEIEALLIDYDKVDNLDDVPVGTHIRYFEYIDGEFKFRVGGILSIKKGLPKYIILTNNKVSWSVQVNNTIFFRRITANQIRKEFEELLLEKDNELNELRAYIKQLNKEIKRLTKK